VTGFSRTRHGPPDGGHYFPLNGILVIDKPAGPTSHDIVTWLRRVTGERRIGHTGTLDPLATGVLPLALGKATRLVRFFVDSEKTYEARIRLGAATTTYDAAGEPVGREASGGGPAWPPGSCDRAAIDQALLQFRGTFLQTPPPFSAKKVQGVRAHRLARANTIVRLTPVAVTVHQLAVQSFEGTELSLRIVCSAGFYVRSLAHDLGEVLGCGAHLEALRRTRSGEFGIEQAIRPDQAAALGPALMERVIPTSGLLPRFPAVVVTPAGARRVAHGQQLGPADLAGSMPGPDPAVGSAPERPVRLLAADGSLVAIATRGPAAVLRPIVVLV
jgi:tRNA pseudouridine55 synthase